MPTPDSSRIMAASVARLLLLAIAATPATGTALRGPPAQCDESTEFMPQTQAACQQAATALGRPFVVETSAGAAGPKCAVDERVIAGSRPDVQWNPLGTVTSTFGGNSLGWLAVCTTPAPTSTLFTNSGGNIYIGYRDGCNVASPPPTKVLTMQSITGDPTVTVLSMDIGSCSIRMSSCFEYYPTNPGTSGLIMASSNCQSLGLLNNGGMDVYVNAAAQCTAFYQSVQSLTSVAAAVAFFAQNALAMAQALATSSFDGVNGCAASTALNFERLQSCLAPSGQFQVCARARVTVCVRARARARACVSVPSLTLSLARPLARLLASPLDVSACVHVYVCPL